MITKKKAEALLYKTVVHCKTEAEANEVLKLADRLKFKWASNDSYLKYNFYDKYKENTCYDIVGGTYCSYKFNLIMQYNIISAQEFVDLVS